jgi:hypothetical protein
VHRLAILQQDADKGIFAFARIAGLPLDRNLIDFYLEGGLNFTGMVPGRPSDVFGVAVHPDDHPSSMMVMRLAWREVRTPHAGTFCATPNALGAAFPGTP